MHLVADGERIDERCDEEDADTDEGGCAQPPAHFVREQTLGCLDIVPTGIGHSDEAEAEDSALHEERQCDIGADDGTTRVAEQ